MSLKERLTNELKEAMKNKDTVGKNVITMIRSDIKQMEVDKRIEASDEDIIEIISRQLKQRRDAKEEFQNGNRQDLVEQCESEIEVLLKYLPKQLSEEEVREIVIATINETGFNTSKDMGKLMSAVMPKVKGKADGKIVNQVVRQSLN
ncbi:GatB/YqeY domain-containing protein [Serpentinicella alkaliphila]|uniref:GatB/YqeY domain-containing protein n=1 Tax=Serpentinicella alkaliphila TaxID=1734049 RepID=A0A4R2TYI0_9FIRM|nr:GatB/YqeY domain-containing protein [Serpentinicella alkaliphila]QUH26909.1 GatB/YqeY domain-containing protein [Serpentinicella alkaliphila]TCQ08142.1 hypothetical protein EDD79_1001231 [Serpentinicella alkaliphila]